jgi:hypothetical protein
MMKPMLLTLALALLSTSALAGTPVYRWVDKDGKVVYGSQPPADAVAEKLPPPKGPAFDDGAAAPSTAAAPAAAPATSPDRDAVEQQVQALLAQRCTAAKAIDARYEKAPYLQNKAADGSLSAMSPEAEARERLRIKDEIKAACREP